MMPASTPSPSALVQELHRLSPADALALVDRVLGPSTEWISELIAFRLSSDSQDDWKIELGQWLGAAEQFGFLDDLVHNIESHSKKRLKNQTPGIDPNDSRHLQLHAQLAVPRIVHYLTATGWTFHSVESETAHKVDIDCSLFSPDGQLVEFQVKAPDQPGRRAGHHYVDGDHDERVIKVVDKTKGQLRRAAKGPALLGVCSNRHWSLAWDPDCLVTHLIGSTTGRGGQVYLAQDHAGAFFSDEWAHVSGVLLLDLLRGAEESKYTCTVLTNPRASFPVSPDWFPRARVCVLDGSVFHWFRGQPGREHGLADGARLVNKLP